MEVRNQSLFLSKWEREHGNKTGDPPSRIKELNLYLQQQIMMIMLKISAVRGLIDQTLGSRAWKENG